MRPQSLLYAVDEIPPPARLAILGIQYAVQIAVYLVIVVIILRHAHASHAIGVNVLSCACIAIAIGTALQALPRGPVGSGFLAPPVFSAIYLAPSVLAAEVGGLAPVFGMTIFAGLIELLLSFCVRRLRVIFQPILAGLTVFVVGLQLGVVGIGETLDVRHEALPQFPLHLLVTTLTLASCVGLSIWGKGAARLFCALIALITGVVASIAIGLIGHQTVTLLTELPFVALPHPGALGYDFNVGLIPAFLAAALAATLRTVGVVTTCQRVNDSEWQRPDMANIERGIRADALGTLIGGTLGAPGMNIAPSLVGISAATSATSRVIAFVAAAILLLFAFLPKVVGGFLELPSEVAGAMLVFTSSFMITSGMQIMLSRTVDNRTIYVISISTLLALSKSVFPTYFTDLSPIGRSFASSDLAIGLTAAVAMTLLFRFGIRQKAHLDWSGLRQSPADGAAFVKTACDGWRLRPPVTAGVSHAAEGILAHIKTLAVPDPAVLINLTYDGLDVILDMRCTRAEIAAAQVATRSPTLLGGDIDNEESAAWVGLQNYLATVYADRKTTYKSGDLLGLEQRFEA
jgi:xanthine permease XanP